MKTIFVLISLFILCLGINSCEEEEVEKYLPKIHTTSYYYNNEFQYSGTHYYDNNGRLIKIQWSDGEYDTYEYSNSSAIHKYFDENNELLNTKSYTLNSDGLAIFVSNVSSSKGTLKSSQFTDNFDYSNSSSTGTYEYNDDGYLIQSTYIDDLGTRTYTYTISEGNCVGYILEWSNTSTPYMVNRIFLEDEINTIGNINAGVNYFGKQSKNLISSELTTSGSYYNNETYTYEYDSKKRVVTESLNVTSSYGNDLYSFTYTYTD
jgi:hypothetical protein